MTWPPKPGEALPRAADAWSEAHKWSDWILAERSHGSEWAHVLRVAVQDVDVLWEALTTRIRLDPITRIRDLGAYGLNCEVDVELAIRGRSARIRTIWNYEGPGAAPRLVSAYPQALVGK